MFCSNCGKALEPGAAVCPACGEAVDPVMQPAPVQAPAAETPAPAPIQTPAPALPVLSKRQFYKLSRGSRSVIRAAAILGYICAGTTLLLELAGLTNAGLFILIDVLLVLGLSLGIQLGKSRVCAILLLIYALFNFVYMLLVAGQISGCLAMIAGGLAVAGTFRFAHEWKKYRAAMLPPENQ